MAPLVLLGYVIGFGFLIVVVITSCSVVGRVGGINQRSLRKLMAYSSINHLAWLMSASYFGVHYLIVYFGVYFLSNGLLVVGFRRLGLFYISQVFYYSSSGVDRIFILMNLLSFGGLPPFLGFFPKWIVINLLVRAGWLLLGIIMVIISLVSLYYYSRLCYVILSQSSVGVRVR